METTHMKTRAYFVAMTLAVLILPLLFQLLAGPEVPSYYPHAGPEFTDIRIVRLDLSVPIAGSDDIQRVTIQTHFSVNSPWCEWDEPNALPCRQSMSGENKEQPELYHGSHDSISSL